MSQYLVKCSGRRYRYQRYIPKDIQWCWKGKSIIKALGTNDKKSAMKLYNSINEKVEQLFSDCRLGFMSPSESRNAILNLMLFDGDITNEMTLKELCNKYVMQNGINWSSKSSKEFWYAINKLEKFLTKPPRFIDVGTMEKVRDNLRIDGCNPRTINKYLSRISAVLTYAVEKKIIQYNPVPIVAYTIPKNTVKQNSYKPFSDEDIKNIMEKMLADENTYGARYCVYMFWLPIVGAFTGARLGDLCDLNKGSYEKRAGIHLLNIGNQKTGDLPRPVPIHSKLVELGFLKYIDSLGTGESIFKVNRRGTDGQYDYKWWYRNIRDFVEGEDKVFHSFRATVSTRLNNKGVTATWRADLLGHERRTNVETDKGYTTDTEIQGLQQAIELLEYPSVDWKKVKIKLKNSNNKPRTDSYNKRIIITADTQKESRGGGKTYTR